MGNTVANGKGRLKTQASENIWQRDCIYTSALRDDNRLQCTIVGQMSNSIQILKPLEQNWHIMLKMQWTPCTLL